MSRKIFQRESCCTLAERKTVRYNKVAVQASACARGWLLVRFDGGANSRLFLLFFKILREDDPNQSRQRDSLFLAFDFQISIELFGNFEIQPILVQNVTSFILPYYCLISSLSRKIFQRKSRSATSFEIKH